MVGEVEGLGMARDFTTETARIAAAKGHRTQSRMRDVRRIASAILEGRFDMTKNPDMKAALDSINFYGMGLSGDARSTALEAAIIAVHAGRGLSGDLKSAQWVFALAGKSLEGKKAVFEVKKLELEVKQLSRAMETDNAKPETGPEVDTEDIRAEAVNMGVYGQQDLFDNSSGVGV